MGRADMLETEGLMLQGVRMSHVRAGCEAELPHVSIGSVWMEIGKMMAIVRPRSHKAF